MNNIKNNIHKMIWCGLRRDVAETYGKSITYEVWVIVYNETWISIRGQIHK